MTLYGNALPDFPWDTLKADRDRAAQYPSGEVDLTIGSPVDPVPQIARDALVASADSHAYPPNVGTGEWRRAVRSWLREVAGAIAPVDFLPTLGEKEMVALLVALLGIGQGQRVGFPNIAYPTYEVGARLAGAEPVAIDVETDPEGWPADLALLWLNSPSNPTGHVLSEAQLARIVRWAREHQVIVASDECYSALVWDVESAPSVLSEGVCGEDASGLLMLYSLSKQSNLAGYRAAFIAGDPELIAQLRETRKHAGFMMPGMVQHVMSVVLADREHVREQAHKYQERRETLLAALPAAGLVNDPDSVAGLYLWVHAGDGEGTDAPTAWELVHAFAELGIVVAPGTFYGPAGEGHVRISLTASDQDIRDAAKRLPAFSAALARVRGR